MALTRTVTLQMFADTAAAQAKLDAIAAEAKKLSDLNPSIKPEIEKSAALRQMAVLRAELKAQGDAAGQDLGNSISDGTKKGLGAKAGGGSWIATAIGLGAPLAGPLAAAGLGFSAFGLLAAGSLAPVVKAVTGPAGLAAGWSTLDARQKTAAAGVEALKTRYDGLSKSMEPRTFQVFNTLLSTANGLLGPSARLATASGAAVEGFLVKFENDSGLRQFVGYASTVAPQAIGLLGTDVTTLVHSVLTLAQAAGGTGLLELRVLTGGLQAVDTVVSHLPGPVAGAALAITGIALGLSKLGALSGILKITGFAAMGSEAKAAATGIKDASVATRGLAGAQAALDAVSPVGWAVLGAAAIAGLVYAISKLGNGTETTIAQIRKQDDALGFNTRGYFAAAGAVGALGKEQDQQSAVVDKSVQRSRLAAGAMAGMKDKTDALTAAQKNLVSAGREQNSFLGTLESKYGITRQQAIALAQASGVLIDKTGHIKGSFKDAVTQADAYANSMRKADPPAGVLGADLSVMGTNAARAASEVSKVNSAWDTFLGMSTGLQTAELGVIGSLRQIAKESHAAGASFTGVDNASITLQTSFANFVPGVQNVIDSMRTAHASTRDLASVLSTSLRKAVDAGALANRGFRQQIYDMAQEAGYAGPNKIAPLKGWIDRTAGSIANAKGITDKWAGSLAKIPKGERTAISVTGSGTWQVVGGQGSRGRAAAAAGMRVTGGIPGVDSVPILAQRDETVLSVAHSRQLAPILSAIGVPGYAAGGVVGSYAGTVPGLGKWLISEDKATISALSSSVAAATLAGMKAAAAAHARATAGGGGHAGPGGGSASANEALARSLFPFGAAQWAPFVAVAMRESGFSNVALNASSGAYGIAQALPASKYPLAGRPPSMGGSSNPTAQLTWMFSYIAGRYGTPANAEQHELTAGWYGSGLDAIFRKPTLIGVGERGAEHVSVTPAVSGSVTPAVSGGHGTGGGSGPPPLTARQIAGLALAVYYEHPQSATADRAEEKKYLRDIAKYYSGSSAKWRDKAVERQTGHLISVGDKISALSSKIASARSYQQSVQQGLAGYADLSQMTLGGSMQGSRTLSGAQSLNAQLGGQLGNLRKFAGVLRKLAAAKVDSSLIRQVVSLGPGDGTAFGEEILAGGPALIKSLNATETAIGKTETQISRGAASAVYEGRYEPGKDFLKQLQAQKAGLRELFRDLGQELGREASRWFRVPRRRRPKGMAAGGVISEPIYGWGASGQEYMLGERGPERVTPLAGGGRTGPLISFGGDMVVRQEADLAILSQKVGFAISAAGLG